MPYTNTVSLIDLTPLPSPVTGQNDEQLTATLWMLWNVAGGPDPGRKQMDAGDAQVLVNTLEQTPPVQFSFPGPADFSANGMGVGLSMQDAHGNWLFRSGSYPDTLPTDPLEIVATEINLSDNGIQGLLPAMPMQVDSSTTLSSLTATLADADRANNLDAGLDFIATGTTNAPGVVVDLQFTGRLVFQPSSDVAAGTFEAMSVGVENPYLVFTSGPSVISSIEAAVFNALETFIWHDYSATIVANISDKLNETIITSAGRQFTGGPLPAGVNLSVRTVDVSSVRGMDVQAALGAFGGVLSKFPTPPGGSNCPLIALTTLGLLMSEIAVLRDFRDHHMALDGTGQRLVELYYRAGPEALALLRADQSLARSAFAVASDLAAALRCQKALTQTLRARGEALARELADRGSPELRQAISDALASPMMWPFQ